MRRYRASAADVLADPAGWIAAGEGLRLAGERLELAVCRAGERAPLGSVSVSGVHHRNRDAMVSWWMAASGRGQGLGTRAVGLVCGWVFAALSMERIGSSIEEDNIASRALAERCGFVCGGDCAPTSGGPMARARTASATACCRASCAARRSAARQPVTGGAVGDAAGVAGPTCRQTSRQTRRL